MQDPNGWNLVGATVHSFCNSHLCNEITENSLNVHLCIGNTNGQLVFKNGNFGHSCTNCFVQNGNQLNYADNGEIYDWFGYLACFTAYQPQPLPHGFYCKEPPQGWQPVPDMTDTACGNDGCPCKTGNCGFTIDQVAPDFTEGADASRVPNNVTTKLPSYLQEIGL
ncbi:hypothetical protein BKA67DRAFT_663886 [Truncatella angustata]|uniref:Cyanovirin-N domain-containing protein n=1 Tax=Truncatella angustata TaxID=152316 RepID=A0A9P8RMT3_9PEZI|nr:uncharacterized protein BKA67DRAFT_663886 [Truncatella angustata]KAH6646016.1 hypothetical protein BKA67DRAFT_663886 [Truncatella angustata]